MTDNFVLDKNIISFPEFNKLESIIHGTTSRDFHTNPFDKQETMEKIRNSIGIPKVKMACGEQVHQSTVAQVEQSTFPSRNFHEFDSTDALITNQPNILLSVVSADCVPIFLADPFAGVVGVIHAGWRGTFEKIVSKSMRRLQAMGAKPFQTHAMIGPCISQQNYQVSEELIEQFREKFPNCNAAFESRQLSLEMINLDQLMKSGLKIQNITLTSLCTYENKELFHSYRRDGSKSGRLYSFIMLKNKTGGP